MKRVIKFRGKSIAGDWEFGDLSQWNEEDSRKRTFISIEGLEPVEVMPDTVGQFTGLHDKDGKEIYEDDIICSSRGNMHYVIYDNTHACFAAVRIKDGTKAMCSISAYWIGHFDKKVIGNILDNQELLKGGGE